MGSWAVSNSFCSHCHFLFMSGQALTVLFTVIPSCQFSLLSLVEYLETKKKLVRMKK